MGEAESRRTASAENAEWTGLSRDADGRREGLSYLMLEPCFLEDPGALGDILGDLVSSRGCD